MPDDDAARVAVDPANAPCDDCTGEGGRGHTMRGACAGAPCPGGCGQRRYHCVCEPAEADAEATVDGWKAEIEAMPLPDLIASFGPLSDADGTEHGADQ